MTRSTIKRRETFRKGNLDQAALAVVELIKLDDQSAGAIDLSEAIEKLQLAIRELLSKQWGN